MLFFCISHTLIKLSGPICGVIMTFKPSQNSLPMFSFVLEQCPKLLACQHAVSLGKHAWLLIGVNVMSLLLGVPTPKSVLEMGNLWPDLSGVAFLGTNPLFFVSV